MLVFGDKVIDSFKGEWEMFSNFYPCIVYLNDYNFASTEIAYQAAKTKDGMAIREFAELNAKHSGKAKRMGRKVKLRDDWDIVKLSIMKRLLMQKFSQTPFRLKLLSTGNALIVEGNYWHDNYWGDCKCEKCKTITGRNQLGVMLMEIREIVK